MKPIESEKGKKVTKKNKPRQREIDPDQPSTPKTLSAWSWAFISFLFLLVALSFTVFYVKKVPELIEVGYDNKIFYLLLIPWAAFAAAFLVGAMNSYARFVHKEIGTYLEVSGAAVIFGLVIWGGFKLVPPLPELFDLAVRAHSEAVPMLTYGTIVLDSPGLPHASIGPDGEANFKGLPARLNETTIRILPQIDGFEKAWQAVKIVHGTADLDLKKSLPKTVISGSILPLISGVQKLRIMVDGNDQGTFPDEFGRFKLEVNGKTGDRVRVKIFNKRVMVYDDFQLLPGPVTLKLKR